MIPKLTPRNRCELMKCYLHLCDNSLPDWSDKWTKLRPFIEQGNRKIKFPDLSDKWTKLQPFIEQGNRKIKFPDWSDKWTKLQPFIELANRKIKFPDWSDKWTKLRPYITKFIHHLVNFLDHPEQKYLYFNNLLCTVPLLEDLRQRKIKATGKIGNN